jgi:hypothetical protein
LRLDDLKGPLVFVGDESSFALVGAWQTQHVDEQPVSVVCEVDDAHESSEVLGAIGISPVNLLVRRVDATHVPELAASAVKRYAGNRMPHFA